jgi:hypothetical protein
MEPISKFLSSGRRLRADVLRMGSGVSAAHYLFYDVGIALFLLTADRVNGHIGKRQGLGSRTVEHESRR